VWQAEALLQPATWIPPKPNHTETPTHIKTRTHDQCDWGDIRVAGRSFSLQHGYHPNSATPKLQHTSKQEHTISVVGVVSVLQAEASACNTDTTPTQPHQNSNTHQNKNTRPTWLRWYPCSRLKHCFNLPHGYHPNPATPKLQHTSKHEHMTNVVAVVSTWQAESLLQPATWIPLQPNHTETQTHIETRTHDQCGCGGIRVAG